MRTEATRRAAIDLVLKGTPKTAVAKQMRVSRSTIDYWLKHQGKKQTRTATTETTVLKAIDASQKAQLGRIYEAIGTLRDAGLI